MPTRILVYVALVVVAALAAAIGLTYASPKFQYELAAISLAFSLLGLLAQKLAHSAKVQSRGSIAFLPFLAGLVLFPSWVTVTFIAAAMLTGEVTQKKAWIKRVFNVAQYTLAVSVAGLVYVLLGGKPLELDPTFRAVPHILSVLSFLLLNTALVAGVIALSTGRGILDVWRQNGRGSIAYDLFAIPVVYFCAFFYVKLGWPGIAFGFVALGGARQLYMKNRLLETAYEETLEILVGAVELRDPYTSGHSQRVRKYSQIIASALELPTKEIERIGRAALLHDVGKIDGMFVPILQKPGRLTDEERGIMELHPLKSAELVSKASQLSDIVDIVRHHHENWDGTGYPAQLAGRDIPLGSRIIMFADTIDAMTTDRPYRKALGEQEVRSELQKFRGKQFDPDICDRLVRSTEFARIFDSTDSGRVQSITQIFDRVRRRNRTPAVA
jgi:HD-GYP domain-containing protein (c-di-GMP phosphodiesterase class II)